MDSVDIQVFEASQRWLTEGANVILVTVVRTWGSSPRPPGAVMAIRGDGRVVGSVSGGCIEEDLIDSVRLNGCAELCPGGKPSIRAYGIAAEEAHRFGLPCGGTIRLVLEPLTKASLLSELLRYLESRQLTERRLDLTTGEVVLRRAVSMHEPTLLGRHFHTTHGPRARLVVIGAGDLSRFFCEIALGLDFEILVCDPRTEYTAEWTLPGVRLTREMPDDVVLQEVPDSRTAVVALTHDPKLDDLALMHALQSEAFYVGAIGSRANNARRIERLREHFDLKEEELSRLRGPAGLYIGSKSPPEIAISILAEIIACKNGVALPVAADVAQGKISQEGRTRADLELNADTQETACRTTPPLYRA